MNALMVRDESNTHDEYEKRRWDRSCVFCFDLLLMFFIEKLN